MWNKLSNYLSSRTLNIFHGSIFANVFLNFSNLFGAIKLSEWVILIGLLFSTILFIISLKNKRKESKLLDLELEKIKKELNK